MNALIAARMLFNALASSWVLAPMTEASIAREIEPGFMPVARPWRSRPSTSRMTISDTVSRSMVSLPLPLASVRRLSINCASSVFSAVTPSNAGSNARMAVRVSCSENVPFAIPSCHVDSKFSCRNVITCGWPSACDL